MENTSKSKIIFAITAVLLMSGASGCKVKKLTDSEYQVSSEAVTTDSLLWNCNYLSANADSLEFEIIVSRYEVPDSSPPTLKLKTVTVAKGNSRRKAISEEQRKEIVHCDSKKKIYSDSITHTAYHSTTKNSSDIKIYIAVVLIVLLIISLFTIKFLIKK